jgi:two-component system, chemotaxis family, sensor kinase CheA
VNSECDFSVLVDDFIDDAGTHLESVERSLLELETRAAQGGCDERLVTAILGNLHTFKGNAGMMGFAPLQRYLHQVEEVFKHVVDASLTLDARLFETLYGALNALRRGLAQLARDPAGELDFCDEQMALEILTMPQENVATLPLPSPAAEQLGDFDYITQKSGTLKVSFEKLDELLNLMGELVIHRTSLVNLERRLSEQLSDRELLAAFGETSQLIGKSTTDLRQAIMKARMLPVKTVFQRFQRLVRDLSRSHGKEVALRFEGEETELDKSIIDEIGEPLLHLIRNAVDHGMESPVQRMALGKPQGGTLWLRARHESNHIVIAVSDDGRGMSPEQIRRVALERGVIGPDAASALSDGEILQLVFAPGFSTSSEVTETSGRGIGLDVVKKIVDSFNGVLDIESSPGIGTTFTIKLPLTLAILTALMVEVAGETYAIPLTAVEESIQVAESEFHQVGERELIRLRDRILPLHRLDRFFGHDGGQTRQEHYVVVVSSGEKRAGLVVDRLVGQQEIVIKGLDDYLGELPGISGGTVLGDGRVSLIIDTGSILGR